MWRTSLKLLKEFPLPIVAIIGIYFTYSDFSNRQPNVAIDLVAVEHRFIPINIEEIKDRLNKIEISSLEVHFSIRSFIEAAAAGLEDGTAIESFRTTINTVTHSVDVRRLVEDLRTIQRNLTTTSSNALKEQLRVIEDRYRLLTERTVLKLIDEIDNNNDISNGLQEAISEFEKGSKNYDPIRDDLIEILNFIDNYIDAAESKLYVEVNVENLSHTPTIIQRSAMVRIWDGRQYVDVDIYTEGAANILVDGISVSPIEFSSKNLSALDSGIRLYLVEEFAPEFHCLIFLVDTHGNVWNTDRRCSRKQFSGALTIESDIDRVFRTVVAEINSGRRRP
ncbi:MAG: hypothetical protein OXJ62_09365 [Spirochaetaceae bacterium]|nr:hypothetical protein [Spirochaetaceae bacterium]